MNMFKMSRDFVARSKSKPITVDHKFIVVEWLKNGNMRWIIVFTIIIFMHFCLFLFTSATMKNWRKTHYAPLFAQRTHKNSYFPKTPDYIFHLINLNLYNKNKQLCVNIKSVHYCLAHIINQKTFTTSPHTHSLQTKYM